MQILAVSNPNLNQTTKNIQKNSPTKLQTLSRDTVSFGSYPANAKKIGIKLAETAQELIEGRCIHTRENPVRLNEVYDGITEAIQKAKITNKGLEGHYLHVKKAKGLLGFDKDYIALSISDGIKTYRKEDICLTIAIDDRGQFVYDSITNFLESIK